MNDGCVIFVHTTSVWGGGGGGKVSDCLIRLYAVVTLKASVLTARSENGFIHVWNLKTHRVDTELDGHGRKSVYYVETIGSKNRLLRLAKQAKNSEIILVSVMIEEEKKKERKKRNLLFLESLKVSPTHTEMYRSTKIQKNCRTKSGENDTISFFMICVWQHHNLGSIVSLLLHWDRVRPLGKGNTLGFEVDGCFTTGSQGRSKLIERVYKKREERENEVKNWRWRMEDWKWARMSSCMPLLQNIFWSRLAGEGWEDLCTLD